LKLIKNLFFARKIPNSLTRSAFASEQEQPQEKPRGRFFKPKAKYNPNCINPHNLMDKLNSIVSFQS